MEPRGASRHMACKSVSGIDSCPVLPSRLSPIPAPRIALDKVLCGRSLINFADYQVLVSRP